MSNPVPTDFYFKPGSLALRRFQLSEHETEREYYGEQVAGKTPDVGEIQEEPELVPMARDHWVKADAERGDRSLERAPDEEIYCLVQAKGKWTFPSTSVKAGQGLDEAVSERLVGAEGALGGRTMDTWLVTRKPIGVVRDGEKRVSPSRWMERD